MSTATAKKRGPKGPRLKLIDGREAVCSKLHIARFLPFGVRTLSRYIEENRGKRDDPLMKILHEVPGTDSVFAFLDDLQAYVASLPTLASKPRRRAGASR